MRLLSAVLSFVFCLLLSACITSPDQVTRPVPAATAPSSGTLRLVQADFGELPGWAADRPLQAWPAFMQSCRTLGRKAEWASVCARAQKLNAPDDLSVRDFFQKHFTPYQAVLDTGDESGLATGYYEPLLQGSRKRGGAFQTPLHSRPADLVTVELALVHPELKGKRLRGKLSGNRLLPYPSRGELRSSRQLEGLEIVWVDDAVDAFFLQVQGSGRVALAESGETIRLAYADQNGHPYRSIGRYLVDLGELKLEAASAQQIKSWLAANPGRFHEVLDANPSYVFFKEEILDDPARGPNGAMGLPLTAGRSVAVDPRFIPLGMPLFLDTTEPNSAIPLQRLVMAQDTGGAIKGPLRIDYFWGFGRDAGEAAGKMKQPVRIWLLYPRDYRPAGTDS